MIIDSYADIRGFTKTSWISAFIEDYSVRMLTSGWPVRITRARISSCSPKIVSKFSNTLAIKLELTYFGIRTSFFLISRIAEFKVSSEIIY